MPTQSYYDLNNLSMIGEQCVVAFVSSNNEVKHRSVTIAGNDGKAVRVITGIEDGEHVVLNPILGITEKKQVRSIMVPTS